MEILNDILTIFLSLCIFYFFKFLVYYFWPSYFKEKGKNLATKEDVAEITSLVEEVKHSFIIQNEKLKSNLSILSATQTGIISEERNAIISYNDAISKWINSLTDPSIGNIDLEDNIALAKYGAKIGDHFRDVQTAEAKLDLFVANEDLIKSSHNLKISVLEELQHITDFLINIKHNNIEKADIDRTQHSLDSKAKALEKVSEDRKSFKVDYHTKMISGLKVVLSLLRKFRSLSRTHIHKIFEDNI